jgi:hypothetical protein
MAATLHSTALPDHLVLLAFLLLLGNALFGGPVDSHQPREELPFGQPSKEEIGKP